MACRIVDGVGDGRRETAGSGSATPLVLSGADERHSYFAEVGHFNFAPTSESRRIYLMELTDLYENQYVNACALSCQATDTLD